MIVTATPEVSAEARVLWKEANELLLIFISIIKKSKENGGH